MKIKNTLFSAAVASAMISPLAQAEPAPARPNILYILADDLGWMDLACQGSTFYRTPNIDRLAKEGVRFTAAYASPLCSPSRVSAITGRYPARVGMTTAIAHGTQPEPSMPESTFNYQKVVDPISRNHLPLSEVTTAELLAKAGYETFFVGKWHIGAPGPFGPERQGFQKVPVAGGAAAGYFAPHKWLPDEFSGPEGEYLTERLSRETIQFLKSRPADAAPFFVALWHFNVHDPYEAKPEVIKKYEALVDPNNPQHNPVMAAMIEGLDDSVGEVIAALDEMGLAENTLVVFTSDNGGVTYAGESVEKFPGKAPPTSNLPLRGGKGSIFEGGVRVPMIIRWPGVAKPGLVVDQPVTLCDLLPTFVEAAGGTLPPDLELDGISLVPALEGGSLARQDPIFWHFPFPNRINGARLASGVRVGDFKLLRFYGEGPDREPNHELYNMIEDIGETQDLATKNPEKVAELSSQLDAMLKKTGALIPVKNPAYDPNEPMPKRWQNMLNP